MFCVKILLMSLKKELQKIVRGKVYSDRQTLEKYSRDASIFQVKPQLVIAPKSVSDIKNLVKFINSKFKIRNYKLSLTARSAGTDMTGGPLNDSIILDFTKYFNKIKKVSASQRGGYAIAQPGVYYRDFEKKTLAKNLLLPSYPSSREICAIGGMVANNAGGEKTLAYGKTENFVRKLKVVLSDGNEYAIKPLSKQQLDKKIKQSDFEGEIYRQLHKLLTANYKLLKNARPKVSKNSSGYALWNVWDGKTFDLTRLFTGSQGTLGVITEIKFRLIKPQRNSRLLIIFLKDISLIPAIAEKILRLKPESFEFFDNYTMKLALRYLMWKHFWRFLPESLMFLQGGFPKLVMIAQFAANSDSQVKMAAADALKEIKKMGLPARVARPGIDTEKYWLMRRESFNLLRGHFQDKKPAPFIDDLIVRPEKLPQFLPQLEKILSRYDFEYTIVGHIGDGNLHIIPLMDLTDPLSKKIIKTLSKKVYQLVFAFGGSMSAEHNDGLIRTPYLKEMFGGEVCQLFKETKKIFDPNNIFNPGKKV